MGILADSRPLRSLAPLPGTGGAYKLAPADFVVEEIPLYPPKDQGDHTFLWIEKRGRSTPEAVRALAEALGSDPRAAGTAGLKDRQATTRQWISLYKVDPERARGLELEGVRVLDARRHPHKLRTGHLAGNRFTVTLRGCSPSAAAHAGAALERLANFGLPNYYGEQRFGRQADNAERGRELLAGGRPPRDPRERRLLLSALQSELFNAVVTRRLRAHTLRRALAGDVLAKTDSGGLFVCADPAADQPRVDAWAIVPTGPMFGPAMKSPAPGSEPALLEAAVLADAALTPEAFARAGRLAEGTRRALVIRITAVELTPVPPDALTLSFALPPGSYATVLLDEIIG